MAGIASSATAVLICHIAGGTSTIRVGSGGIMLPNHPPLVIAEQFGTLASLFPDRIDLGLGRAPGTDQFTAHALRRNLTGNVDDFPNDVIELQRYLNYPEDGQRVIATPGYGTQVPIWILGSSLFGAQLAAALGLPYAFASHFAPQELMNALKIYRERFKPSAQLQEPYVMAGFNICIADTDEEAIFLRSSALKSMLQLRRGMPIQLPPPQEDFYANLTPQEQSSLSMINECSAVGSLQTATDRMREFIEKTGVDELMCVCSVFDHDKRLESFRLAVKARGC